MAQRIRPISAQITLTAVVDDGDHLTPVVIDPMTVSAIDFPGLDLTAIVADLQKQLDAGQE